MRAKKNLGKSLDERLRAVREDSESTSRAPITDDISAAPTPAFPPGPVRDAPLPALAPPLPESVIWPSSPSADGPGGADFEPETVRPRPTPRARPEIPATDGSAVDPPRSGDPDLAAVAHLLWAASEGDTFLASGASAPAAPRRAEVASSRLELGGSQGGTDTRTTTYDIPRFATHTVAAEFAAVAVELNRAPVEAEPALFAGELLEVEPAPAAAEIELAVVRTEPETETHAPDSPARFAELAVEVVEVVDVVDVERDRFVAEVATAPELDVEPEPDRRAPEAAIASIESSAEALIEPEPAVEPEPEPVPQSEPALVQSPPVLATADEPWSRSTDRAGRFGRIGTTMIERGLITNEQLDAALDVQRTTGRRVGEILVEMNAISRFELVRVLADHMGVPFIDLKAKPPDAILGALLPEEVARRYRALVIDRWNNQLVIAMANPSDLFALDDLQMVMRQPLITAMAVEDDLLAAIDRVYRVSDVETTLDAAAHDYVSSKDDAILGLVEVDEGPVVRLVNALLEQAIRDHASDLHIEPSSTRIAVRFRVDGVLHDSSDVPLALLRPLVSRVKILSNLDIAQNRVAEDGRFSVTVQGRPVDVRVVTVPTAAGEAVILRLLDPTRSALAISSLGLNPAEQARFVPPFFASQGAALIVGPTGSGKTSTVYTLLSEINTRSKSIISVEDPVEYRLDGIKQIQANPRVGVTFATTLPSILRSDPDIVFIGEVRDAETARIAADASITGHLVLSTLHATRSAAAPMRLIEMGVEPYLVASALTLVAAQRLARRLCDRCAQSVEASEVEQLRQFGADDAIIESATVRRAVGCAGCRNTGYLGRLPILEIMPVTEPISRLILDRAPRAQIERLAVEEGMETMTTAAMRRVAAGVMSVEEMMRIIS